MSASPVFAQANATAHEYAPDAQRRQMYSLVWLLRSDTGSYSVTRPLLQQLRVLWAESVTSWVST